MKVEFRNPKIPKFETYSKIEIESHFVIPKRISSFKKYYPIN